jgi:hypothetical protein
MEARDPYRGDIQQGGDFQGLSSSSIQRKEQEQMKAGTHDREDRVEHFLLQGRDTHGAELDAVKRHTLIGENMQTLSR